MVTRMPARGCVFRSPQLTKPSSIPRNILMESTQLLTDRPRHPLIADLSAGLVVFLVALPLCLGVALASNAPLFSGILAGIVGGLVVGAISKSQTSVSGPAAGLTAVVAAQIAAARLVPGFSAGRDDCGRAADRVGRDSRRGDRGFRALQCDQGIAGGHRADPDPQATAASGRPRRESVGDDVVRRSGPRKHVFRVGAPVQCPASRSRRRRRGLDRHPAGVGQDQAAQAVTDSGAADRRARRGWLEFAPGPPGRSVDHRRHAPGASSGGGQPGRFPRIPAVAGRSQPWPTRKCTWRP